MGFSPLKVALYHFLLLARLGFSSFALKYTTGIWDIL